MMLGRALKKNEAVHHIDGERWDDRPENLYVCNKTDHLYFHCGRLPMPKESNLPKREDKCRP
jgi:hypothetical protein